MTSDPTATLLARLDAQGYSPRPTGRDSWEAKCPGHNGDRRNLTITRGDDGRALLRCHAYECKPEAIVQALGLELRDLFPARDGPPRPSAKAPLKPSAGTTPRTSPTPEAALAGTARKLGCEPSAWWTYHEADGSELLRVYRFDPPEGRKEYRPAHPTASGWAMGDPPGPLPLYNLPALADADRVWLCEGEKCADLAAGLGLIATTWPHGARAVSKADWSPLSGREVVVMPDADEPGEAAVSALVAELGKLSPRPTVRVVRVRDLWRTDAPIPEGADIEEWLRDGVPEQWEPDQCRAALERAADAALVADLDAPARPPAEPEAEDDSEGSRAPADWPDEPRPIRYELRPVPALGPESIPEPFRGWLADIAERVGCPLEFPAVGALVSVAVVVGRKLAIRPKRRDDWRVTPNLWGGVVGRPGLLKTPALTEATKPIRRLEADARRRHEEAVAAFQAAALVAAVQADAAKKALKDAAKDRKPKAVLDALARDATQAAPPAAPVLRRYTTTDPTVEALGELLRDNPDGIGLIRDELTGWLNSFEKADRQCDRSFYLEAWNGSGPPFTYDRIGRGTILIPSPCVSILGGIQPGPLRSLIRRVARGEEADDGLISRFQLLVWPDAAAEWRNVDRWPDTAAKNRAYAIFQALDALAPADLDATPDEDGGPPSLGFDPDAQDLFDSWRADLEAKVRAPEESPLIESHLSKYRSLMPSLALLFHLIDTADGAGVGPVRLRAAELAVRWCTDLEAHIRRVYACVADPDLEPARALAEKIKAGTLASPFAYRDLYRRGWSNLDTPEAARRAVGALEDLGWTRAVESRDTGGAPRVDVHLHPKLPRKGEEKS